MPAVDKKLFKADDVITALLCFMPTQFNNDPQKIHSLLFDLQKKDEFKDLLGELDFIEYSRFPYSPLLDRILSRLQESRLLSSMNPEFVRYEIKKESMTAIESYYLKEGRILHDMREKLEIIAKELRGKLEDAG